MSITIGGQTLATKRPDDLDAALVASTGCTAAEHVAILSTTRVTAVQVAAALAPLLASDDVGAPGALAARIGAAGPAIVARDVVPLLRAPSDTPVAPAPVVDPQEAH